MRIWWMILLAFGFVSVAKAEPPRVVASILPVHSIVASVMEGVGEPALLVPPGASPHAYAMRPSEAEALSKADLVVWIGPQLSSFLVRPLQTLAPEASHLTLMDIQGLHLLPVREGGSFDDHDHAHGHGHDDHDDHDSHAHREGHDDEDHDDHAHKDGGGHSDDRPEEPDPHIWLDTHNAEAMAHAIAERLSKLDPGNAATYQKNAADFAARMDVLDSRLSDLLKPAAGQPFVVFHDAWQHFERQFGLMAVGSITINPEQRPGARHISRLRSKISDLGAVCVFSEPQFDDRLIDTLTRGSEARQAEADPLGDLGTTPGAGYYEASMTRAAEAFRDCLVN